MWRENTTAPPAPLRRRASAGATIRVRHHPRHQGGARCAGDGDRRTRAGV